MPDGSVVLLGLTSLNFQPRSKLTVRVPWFRIDIALTGTATADTTATGSPASNAIDGSASTVWCATQWTGNVTVDLGRVRTLDGLGITLGASATTALVNFSAGDDPNNLRPIGNATQQSVPAAEPAHWPEPNTQFKARYVKVDVTDTDGAHPVHRRTPPVRPNADHRDPGSRRRPFVRAPGGGGRRALHRARARPARRSRS